MLLATLISDAAGIVDIYSQTTYGAGMIPFDRVRGGLCLAQVLNEPTAPYTRETYERAVIQITGGFAD